MGGGYQSEVAPIRTMLLKHPREAFGSAREIADQWRGLGFSEPPNFARSIEEYERFVELLRGFDIEIRFLARGPGVGLDSIYVRDVALVSDRGAVLCSMGKEQRRDEPQAARDALAEVGVAIAGSISGAARIEGGDVVWLDQRTLAVGRGYRTNDAGIAQLGELAGSCADEMLVVPLPHWRGPGQVLHLMSMLSPLDEKLLLVYSALLPIVFREELLSRGFELIELPDSEFDSMGCNVLAVAPRVVLMLAGNPETRKRLERAGVDVHVIEGREICLKGAGGPTCLTRPLLRG